MKTFIIFALIVVLGNVSINYIGLDIIFIIIFNSVSFLLALGAIIISILKSKHSKKGRKW